MAAAKIEKRHTLSLPLEPPPSNPESPPSEQEQHAFSYYLESALALQRGDSSRALTALQQALTFHNSSSFLWTALAAIYWEQGETVLAEESLSRASAQGAKSYEMFLLRGFIELHKGNTQVAVQAFEAARALKPQESRANEMLAIIYAQQDNLPKAIAELDKAITNAPEDINPRLLRARCFVQQKNFARAEEDLRSVISRMPQESIYEELANVLKQRGNATKEVAFYREALALFPNNCQIRQNLAQRLAANGDNAGAQMALWKTENASGGVWCAGFEEPLALLYLQSGKYRDAIALLDGIIRSAAKPGQAEKAYYFLALAYEGLDDVQMALKNYGSIAKPSSLSSVARFREARIFAGSGNISEAITKLEGILPAPGLPEAYLFLAHLYNEQGKVFLAIATLRQALKNNEKDVEALYSLGYLLGQEGRNQEALALMKKVLSISPNHTEALNFIGYSYAEQGVKLQEAQELLTKALAQNPKNGQILDSMGWLLFKQKRYAEAQKYLEEARTLLSSESLVLEHLAQLYEKTGNKKEANAIYLQILKTNRGKDEKIQKKIKELNEKPTNFKKSAKIKVAKKNKVKRTLSPKQQPVVSSSSIAAPNSASEISPTSTPNPNTIEEKNITPSRVVPRKSEKPKVKRPPPQLL